MLYDLNRYEDAISKYETVMKTEPEVPVYSTRAKERICHCLSKVILLISLCKCLQDKHETELPQLHEFGFTFASLESAGYRSHQTLYRSSAAGTNQCECPERQSRSLFARRHVWRRYTCVPLALTLCGCLKCSQHFKGFFLTCTLILCCVILN